MTSANGSVSPVARYRFGLAAALLSAPSVILPLAWRAIVSGLVTMFGAGAMTNSIDEIRDTEMMFVIGSNTSEAHPIIAMEMKRAVKNGSRLVVADPREIWLAEVAEKHLQLLQCGILDDGVWATNVEILGTASMIGYDIVKNTAYFVGSMIFNYLLFKLFSSIIIKVLML